MHCPNCKQDKSISEFPKKKKISYDYRENSTKTKCLECYKLAARKWRSSNPNYNQRSGKILKVPLEDRIWMSAIRARLREAKKRSLLPKLPDCNLTEDYLYALLNKQKKKCALSGVDLIVKIKHPLCLSLDQIKPSEGYIKGNVQWLAWCVNRAKGDLSQSDFIDMCKAVTQNAEYALS